MGIGHSVTLGVLAGCAVFTATSRAGSFEAAIPSDLRPKMRRHLAVVSHQIYEVDCTSEEVRDTIDREERCMFSLIDESTDEVFRHHSRYTAKYWIRMRMNQWRYRYCIPEEKLL